MSWRQVERESFGGGVGGADRDRTDDPLLAKQMLSQLSYSPRAVLSGLRDED
jgi:hypothetical protein